MKVSVFLIFIVSNFISLYETKTKYFVAETQSKEVKEIERYQQNIVKTYI